MAIDLDNEPLLNFTQAAELLPVGSRPSSSTWWRWHRYGIGGVKLETVVVGGARLTTKAALERFIVASSAAKDAARSQPGGPACQDQ